jgi:hypothetical protein
MKDITWFNQAAVASPKIKEKAQSFFQFEGEAGGTIQLNLSSSRLLPDRRRERIQSH